MGEKPIIDEEIKEKLESEAAMALIKSLYDKNMISRKTYNAVKKDAILHIAKKEGV